MRASSLRRDMVFVIGLPVTRDFFLMVYIQVIQSLPGLHQLTLDHPSLVEYLEAIQDVQVEFYSTTLPVTMSMFVKRDGRKKLIETMDEAIKMEKDMISLKENWRADEKKTTVPPKKHVAPINLVA